jgi:sulfate transport system ATP-binding protein
MSIEVKNISKTFKSFKALDDVSVFFPDGKLTALLGPSGSGKTTLLRLIAGLEQPDQNQNSAILFHGNDVAQNAVGKRQVGFVFQHYALFKHMTVFENIAFGLRVKKKSERPSEKEISNTVHELLGLIQLDSMANRLPSQLSGGQRQRIALARALAIKPKVLLLDEPFGALDAKVRAELRRWLRNLHNELHFTSIFVTHDQEEALEVSDRIVIMNHGKIEQEGTPDEVFHRPVNEFVMHFLGDVNVFHGRIDGITPGRVYIDKSGEGQKANLLIRPHDFEVNNQPPPDKQSVAAQLLHTQTAGPIVKMEFKDMSGNLILVHLSHEEYNKVPMPIGTEMYLSPKQLKVYSQGEHWVGDYSI